MTLDEALDKYAYNPDTDYRDRDAFIIDKNWTYDELEILLVNFETWVSEIEDDAEAIRVRTEIFEADPSSFVEEGQLDKTWLPRAKAALRWKERQIRDYNFNRNKIVKHISDKKKHNIQDIFVELVRLELDGAKFSELMGKAQARHKMTLNYSSV